MATNYTAQQIEDAAQAREDRNVDVEDNWDELGEEYWEGWNELDWFEIDGEKVLVTTLEQHDYREAYVVFQIGTQLFQKDGFFDDDYGYDWDGELFEVEPHQVLVTHYKRKV